ncbi:hypothetical protein GW17_00060104, partial [Ensete ventricosum]
VGRGRSPPTGRRGIAHPGGRAAHGPVRTRRPKVGGDRGARRPRLVHRAFGGGPNRRGDARPPAALPEILPPPLSMASFCKPITLVLILSLVLTPPLHARENDKVGYLEADDDSLQSAVSQKRCPPPSSPSNSGHGTSENNVERFLGSVPSPGIGH